MTSLQYTQKSHIQCKLLTASKMLSGACRVQGPTVICSWFSTGWE